ncbi:hypothetical protein MTR_6g009810 [Medicago truncatula]|uniref:Uncharacterized protein n=1 Tax=Medicago truncatula TaxID=3880 RepID=A0A072U5C9_MEDTR|nr:hypothetical protein MTR_6g009810 [Medicago truncatula]
MSLSCLVDINVMLDTEEPPSTGDCCIYKVPSKIRKLNEEAYTLPKSFPLAPFTTFKPSSKTWNVTNSFTSKLFSKETGGCLNTLVNYIESIVVNLVSNSKHHINEI